MHLAHSSLHPPPEPGTLPTLLQRLPRQAPVLLSPSPGTSKTNSGSGNSLSIQAQIAIGVVIPVHHHQSRRHLWHKSMAQHEVSRRPALALLSRWIVPTSDRGIPTHHFIYLSSMANFAIRAGQKHQLYPRERWIETGLSRAREHGKCGTGGAGIASTPIEDGPFLRRSWFCLT